MMTSRLASATCTASSGAISRISSLSPTITVFEKPKMPANEMCR
jgi:hypothetical protein